MDSVVRLNIQGDGKAVPRRNRRIAGIGRDLQMRGGHLRAGDGCDSGVEPHHDARHGIALNIEVFKISRCDAALPIEDERARKSDSHLRRIRIPNRDISLDFRLHGRVIFIRSHRPFGNGIQNAVSLDGCGTTIRKQWKCNPALFCECGDNFRRIVADGRQTQPLLPKFIHAAFELHELRFAVWSPIGRPEEDKHRPVRTHDRLKCPGFSVLILETKIGHVLPNLRS